MNEKEIIKEFEDAGAILKGHFVLSSGLHSDTYLQCARVMMQPAMGEKLCMALAAKLKEKINPDEIDLVCAPAMGGLIVGYELARALNKPSIFVERKDGEFCLRRGFEINAKDKVLLVEDVITTGMSSLEAVECVRQYGADVIAEACLVNRSQNLQMPFDIVSLVDLDVKTYTEEELPQELKSIPPEKPGSRF